MPPNLSPSASALLVVGAVLTAFACTRTPDTEVSHPPGPPQTAIETVGPPGEVARAGTERLAPIVCRAAARDRPVERSVDVAREGGRIPLQHNARPLATLVVGRHNATAPLSYSITAEASNAGEFAYLIRRIDQADVPPAQLPARFTLDVHYPAECRRAFATAARIMLVRMEDASAIPAAEHDSTRRIVTFEMNRLSRFVVSH